MIFRLYERLKIKASRKQLPTIEELRMAAALPALDQQDAMLLEANLKLEGLGFSLTDDASVHPSTLVHDPI